MLRITLAVAIAALTLTPAGAQKRSPKEAAKAFSLDPAALSTPDAPAVPAPSASVPDEAPAPATTLNPPVASAPAGTDPMPTSPGATAAGSEPAAPDPAANAPIVTRLGPGPSLDTPIEQLIADPRAKAVLDQDMPGLSTDENLIRFQKLSLRRFQPLTGGQMTPALLAKVGADLAALDEKATTVLAPVTPSAKSRRGSRDEGR